MALTYGDVRRWRPDLVEAAGETIRLRKEQLLALEEDLDASGVPPAWRWWGSAAAAARSQVRQLYDRAADVVAEVSAVQRALYAASDAVRTLLHEVQEVDALAAANEFTVTADGTIVDSAAPLPEPQSAAAEIAEIEQRRRHVRSWLAGGVERIMITAAGIDRNLADMLGLAIAGEITAGAVASLPDADLTMVTEDGHYKIGPPETPHIERHDDFEYNSADATANDHVAKAKWMAKLRGAQLLRPDLVDATDFYAHYWSNTGEPREWDYEKAYAEDIGIQGGVDAETARAQAAAEELIAAGHTGFAMTGQASTVAGEHYPVTENWQKAVGGYQVWSSADVRVEGNTVTMEITVHGEDRYNFNRGQADIATGAPDDENGRFTEIGWAQPFDTHGEITRTVTWELGDLEGAEVSQSPEPDSGRRSEGRSR